MNKCEYIVNSEGIIFRKYKTITKEVPKRLGSRGYLEFKMNNKSVSYKRFVAQTLIPNPNNCDKVFSKNGNQFDTRPENLKWVWTRERRTLTEHEAANLCQNETIKQAYLQGDKKKIKRMINSHFDKIYSKLKPEFISDLYIMLNNYADRNLIFDLKSDCQQTYFGLIAQQHRKKVKTLSIDSFENIDKTSILCFVT
jgi:hypothetical protein